MPGKWFTGVFFTAKPKGKGTRLGLAIRMPIVKQSGSKFILISSGTVWAICVGLGMLILERNASNPAPQRTPPALWPTQSQISHSREHPTLIMFAHPRCPCTRASIAELAILMAHCQGGMEARILFFKPSALSDDWAHTDLWRSAERIPGTLLRCDDDASEARRFNAETSGHVLLYGADGKLLFSGGITPARGHQGDNAGRDTLTALLKHTPVTNLTTPAFGCSLFGPDSRF